MEKLGTLQPKLPTQFYDLRVVGCGQTLVPLFEPVKELDQFAPAGESEAMTFPDGWIGHPRV
ncbi:hypothetical protein SR39_10685 [Methylobacterium radiotolerans]|jgi:hypothetical protein|nr:hypothetical protein SR39_10685 [Methylobacterium radiotolerans]